MTTIATNAQEETIVTIVRIPVPCTVTHWCGTTIYTTKVPVRIGPKHVIAKGMEFVGWRRRSADANCEELVQQALQKTESGEVTLRPWILFRGRADVTVSA